MMHYLFSGIPSLLFEPIAVATLLGCITAFFFLRKRRHGIFFWSITVSIAIMLLWRLALSSLMFSSRYASILLYPAVILTVWFCFQMENIFGLVAESFPRLKLAPSAKGYPSFISYLLIVGLTIACLVKILHYNPFDNYSVKLSKTLARETAGKDFRIFTLGERERIAYYSGIDYDKVAFLSTDTKESLYEALKQKILINKNSFNNVYFVFFLKKGEPEPTAQYLQISPDIGSLECIHQEVTSRRKNKKIVLYRYSPGHPNVEVWEKEVPGISSENLCKNGDFEQFLTGKQLEQRIQYYNEAGVSSFYCTPGPLFPIDWWLGITKREKESQYPIMMLSSEQPIAGNYSLLLDSRHYGTPGVNSPQIRKTGCTISGFIRGLEDSTVNISPCEIDSITKKLSFIETISFSAKRGVTYRFSIPVKADDPTDVPKNLLCIITIDGKILVDNVEFISTSREGKE